jgi:hypothetical protein
MGREEKWREQKKVPELSKHWPLAEIARERKKEGLAP